MSITLKRYFILSIHFLSDNNCHDLFMKALQTDYSQNTNQSYKKSFQSYITYLYTHHLSHELIDKAFTWAHTPQGHGYWSALNEAFEEILSRTFLQK